MSAWPPKGLIECLPTPVQIVYPLGDERAGILDAILPHNSLVIMRGHTPHAVYVTQNDDQYLVDPSYIVPVTSTPPSQPQAAN